ncbi:hypothetical protein AC579_968 [Pseudocercospora musae]|uniref:Uncharacterized protein n=1 Tax=Pseudocercospora musae TaxID=113226 RepID=A0A139IUB0_9PEZI|nr:hypothetical protein AC579_968 [Pseudocercospora musae]KXT18350.1 hypothetical protein AC579_968 [Pseudocercospora musae]
MSSSDSYSTSNTTADPPRSPLSPLQSPRGTKFGFGGLPYKPSMSIDSTLLNTSASSSSSSSPSDEHIICGPSICNSPTPQVPSGPMGGWGQERDPAPGPLRIRKKRRRLEDGSFDETTVPKPSDYELEKPWGGSRHFMMSHGLKYYDEKDCDLRKQILDQIRELEWQNRINAAREEFYRDLEKVRRCGSLS